MRTVLLVLILFRKEVLWSFDSYQTQYALYRSPYCEKPDTDFSTTYYHYESYAPPPLSPGVAHYAAREFSYPKRMLVIGAVLLFCSLYIGIAFRKQK